MTVQAWIIFTPEQRDAAVLLNDDGAAKIFPRYIDNPLANNLGEGVLIGCSVAPARLLNDPDYARWVSTVGQFPIRSLDSEVLFLPSEE